MNNVTFNGDKKIEFKTTSNGVNLCSDGNCVHIEFSKVMLSNAKAINDDFSQRITSYSNQKNFTKCYIAYLSSETDVLDGVLNVGYKNIDEQIAKLIKAI